tara:strand:- start:302 stop:1153 length:852 start_codon:yes stop_codon:yes gene_type:complete
MDWSSLLLEHGIDVPVERIQFNIPCPFHEDAVASCSINTEQGVWICFAGCGQGKLPSFFYKLTGRPLEEKEILLSALDFSLFDDLEKKMEDTQVIPPKMLSPVPNTHWIYRRGFSPDIINRWDCSINEYGDFVIPVHNKQKDALGWITRRQQAIPKYLYSKGFKKSQTLFGIHLLPDHVDRLYITEGALDAMWLDSHGYPSVGILGAILSETQNNLISTLHPSEVVLCLDNDEAGQRGIEKAILDMQNRFLVSYIRIPKHLKDVQDIRNANQLNKIIKNKTYW